jgi:Zn-dependent protease with chaperone function
MVPAPKLADLLAQAIFHTLVASLFVEALVRSWRVREPGQRMALRGIALGYPLVVFPLLLVLFPERGAEDVPSGWTLLDGRRWSEVTFLGASLLDAFVVFFAGLGVLLLLVDVVPLVRGLRRPRPTPAEPDPASAERLGVEVPALAAAMGIAAPPVLFLARDAPVLFASGARRPSIVISRGALRLLDAAELRAALAHELAHVARHDPRRSWILLAARTLMGFNPAFQVVARAILRDAECSADDRAAEACGDRVALASALLKLFRASSGWRWPVRRTLPFAPALTEPLERARTLVVEVRCRRLLDPPVEPLPYGGARVALAAAALTTLLFFVV